MGYGNTRRVLITLMYFKKSAIGIAASTYFLHWHYVDWSPRDQQSGFCRSDWLLMTEEVRSVFAFQYEHTAGVALITFWVLGGKIL
jgi:hypothetical protein